ncbi:MAG: helix-turn-helix transcriptional regulator [Hyphomicrobium sp.]|nr:helix-turn-helix transcriptional regulator [Hyphomicrobium sp.]
MSGLSPNVPPAPGKARRRKGPSKSDLEDDRESRAERSVCQRLEVHEGWTREELREARVWVGRTAKDLADRLHIRQSGVFRYEQEAVHPACGWAKWVQTIEGWLDEKVGADGRRWSDIWPVPVPTAKLRESWERETKKPIFGDTLEW